MVRQVFDDAFGPSSGHLLQEVVIELVSEVDPDRIIANSAGLHVIALLAQLAVICTLGQTFIVQKADDEREEDDDAALLLSFDLLVLGHLAVHLGVHNGSVLLTVGILTSSGDFLIHIKRTLFFSDASVAETSSEGCFIQNVLAIVRVRNIFWVAAVIVAVKALAFLPRFERSFLLKFHILVASVDDADILKLTDSAFRAAQCLLSVFDAQGLTDARAKSAFEVTERQFWHKRKRTTFKITHTLVDIHHTKGNEGDRNKKTDQFPKQLIPLLDAVAK